MASSAAQLLAALQSTDNTIRNQAEVRNSKHIYGQLNS